jgi:hypothetical protein
VTTTHDLSEDELLIVRSQDAELLRLVKKVINEAQERVRISSEVDHIMTVLDEAELR